MCKLSYLCDVLLCNHWQRLSTCSRIGVGWAVHQASGWGGIFMTGLTVIEGWGYSLKQHHACKLYFG